MSRKIVGVVGYVCDQISPYLTDKTGVFSLEMNPANPISVSHETGDIPLRTLLPRGVIDTNVLTDHVIPIIKDAIGEQGYHVCEEKPSQEQSDAWKQNYVCVRMVGKDRLVLETADMKKLAVIWEAVTISARAMAREHDQNPPGPSIY